MTKSVMKERKDLIRWCLRDRNRTMSYDELYRVTAIRLSSLQGIVQTMVRDGELSRNVDGLVARFSLV